VTRTSSSFAGVIRGCAVAGLLVGCSHPSSDTPDAGDGGVRERSEHIEGGARDVTVRAPTDASLLVDAGYGELDAADAVSFWVPPDAGSVQPQHGRGEWLHVSGTSIVDPQGAVVRLFGVNRSGTEYECVDGDGIFDGPADVASIKAIKAWNANAVRIPLNEDCWLGINGVAAAYGGDAYKGAIAAYVHLLLANGVYPILDLHWTAPGDTQATGQEPMPDTDHSVTLWTDVATMFRGEANVIFELFNEPWPDGDQDTDAAWDCWQNGGTCSGVSYPVAGMQTLVTAVRATGAGNLVLLGGVEYSNGLSQWVQRKPSDPANNLAVAWHIYPENQCNAEACWDGDAGPAATAAAFPIVATEIGDSNCDATFPTSVMTWLDKNGSQSYLGWTWDTFGASCGLYSLVTDYDGSANGAYGMAFKTHFASVNP